MFAIVRALQFYSLQFQSAARVCAARSGHFRFAEPGAAQIGAIIE